MEVLMSPSEYAEAAERGHQMAARALLDPIHRAKMEVMVGRGKLEKAYPEIYELTFTEN